MTSINTDLTGTEARAAAIALRADIGPDSDIHVSLCDGKYGTKECWYLGVYAERSSHHGPTFSLRGDLLRDLFAQAREKWDELREEHYRRTISAMALEIIRLTDENGEATDAALRSAGYDGDLVRIYGKRAAERATEMAGRGPFTLKTLGGDNGAPVESEEDAR